MRHLGLLLFIDQIGDSDDWVLESARCTDLVVSSPALSTRLSVLGSRLLVVATEAVAHRRQQLIGEVIQAL